MGQHRKQLGDPERTVRRDAGWRRRQRDEQIRGGRMALGAVAGAVAVQPQG